jgi:phosphoglycolate phosphatase-like HAD superfamily hydrolase
VFDFDGTLMPDSTSLFLASRGIKAKDFWARANARLSSGWDQVLAWLDLFLIEVRPGGALAGVTERDLAAFGATLEPKLFPGVRDLLTELRGLVERFNMEIEYYIVSGGLLPLIEACPTVRDFMTAVYASEFDTDAAGVPRGIRRAVTFTEKTRYLFEIHKGLSAAETKTNPLAVNKFVGSRDRRVPFENMIYVGDGETDIPCFSLLESNRGMAFGVLDTSAEGLTKKKVLDLLAPLRVRSLHPPDYGAGTSLAAALRLSVVSIAGRLAALRSAAYSTPQERAP